MSSIASDPDDARRKRRLATDVKNALRELSTQLSLLNHQVGTRADLRDADFDCLDLVDQHGPLSPSALARRAGLHPATLTGVLDRLEKAGWIARERDPADRRSVRIKALRDRTGELVRLFSGMNSAMDELCAGYDEAELELLVGFLRRTAQAGQGAAEQLAE